MTKTRFIGPLIGAVLLAGTGLAGAQNWPARPIHWVVPFPPGASADLTARLMSPRLAEQLKQPVIVENRAGAASIIAMETVAKSSPDGYTILFGNPTVVTSPILFHMSFDPVKELAPVIQLTAFHYVMLKSNSFAPNSVAEVLSLAREKPGAVSCASGGGMSEFGCGLLKALGKIDLNQVRYKGNAPAMNDLVAGQVNLLFDITSAALPNVKGGRVRAIATTSATRRPGPFSSLPTVAETVPGYEVTSWQGVLARSGTPKEVIARLNREMGIALGRDEVRKRLTDLGVEIVGGTTEAFAELIQSDNLKYAKLIREYHLRVD